MLASIEEGSKVKLIPKTRKGKNVINAVLQDDPNWNYEWLVLNVRDRVQFGTDRNGPWLLLTPKLESNDLCRLVHENRDDNFDVELALPDMEQSELRSKASTPDDNDATCAIDAYFEARAKVFDLFGYVENHRAIPLEDSRQYFWLLTGEGSGSQVHYADSELELRKQTGNYYIDDVYTQRFLPRWVYRTQNYTLVCSDPHTDGNKFLRIFDNAKELVTGKRSES